MNPDRDTATPITDTALVMTMLMLSGPMGEITVNELLACYPTPMAMVN